MYVMKINKTTTERFLPMFKRVYYPGSGKDLETLKFILSEIKAIEDIVFCDYIEQLSLEDLSNIEDWELIKEITLTPSNFGKHNWEEFFYTDARTIQSAEANQKESKLYILINKKSHKVIRFYQLGTEGVGTYQVLCKSALRPNLIFLADSGFGCNWDPNIWGEPEIHSGKVSFLKEIARNNRFIMVDNRSTNPWNGYLIEPFINNNRWSLYNKNRNI